SSDSQDGHEAHCGTRSGHPICWWPNAKRSIPHIGISTATMPRHGRCLGLFGLDAVLVACGHPFRVVVRQDVAEFLSRETERSEAEVLDEALLAGRLYHDLLQ